MRRARNLLWALALTALAAAPAANATSVTVQISGTWDTVVDNASVTNGSITAGGAFLATLVYNDAVPGSDPSPNVGAYLIPAASADLVLATGSYSFALASTSPISIGIDDNVGGQDGFGLFAEYFSTSGPLSSGASTGYGYANPALFDNSETAHTSDDLTALPWDINDYDNASYYFLISVLGKGTNKFIELSGTITDLHVLPEPSVLVLAGLACLGFARTRIRG